TVFFLACEKPAPILNQPDRIVEVMTITDGDSQGLRQFPARIEASQRSELAFRLSGKLQHLKVKQGDYVEKGHVLAQLDQADFNTVLKNAQAVYTQRKNDFARAQKLIKSSYISQNEYDLMQSQFKKSKAGLDTAKQNMLYTQLTAPFSGYISERHVENFESITQGETIYSLRDTSKLDVKIDVPERLILGLRSNAKEKQEIDVKVSFAALPDTFYVLRLKESAAKADESTQTFEVTFSMPQPKELNVLPGMTASVRVKMPNNNQQVYLLPSRVVYGDASLKPSVWIVDEKTQTVTAKAVEVGRMQQGYIEVLAGIKVGDVLVSKGAALLSEGEAVDIHRPATAE
ncbi:MAG: efflux RND transporter periplasmic adaptor subunit, partial [Pseudomonadales bacterium]|nr:efflux RND transporter periplasmic adaptor subunit [Pseudomonadales bacterium]